MMRVVCRAGASLIFVGGLACSGAKGPGGGSGLGGDQGLGGGASGTGGRLGSGGTTAGATGGAAGLGGAPVTGAGGTGVGGASGVGGGAGRAGGTGGSGAGGAAGAAPLPGMACAGASPWTTTGTPGTSLVVNAGQRGQPWNRFYEKVVASDHANTILATAYGRNVQAALKKGHDQAGFAYVRFHGILNDDIGVYSEVAGAPVYNWTRLDQVYDAIIAAGMRPFVELSFMPQALASDPTRIQTLLWYNNRSPNISAPRDWAAWQTFMMALVQHLEARYGAAEVRNWYFEIWNEASWMYGPGLAGYNMLYQQTVQGLLRGDPMLRVGGPAESQGGSKFMVDSLIKYARNAANNAKLDFVTYHAYGQSAATNFAIASPNPADTTQTATVDFHAAIMGIASANQFTGNVFVTEWGPTYALGNAQSDNEVAASYIAKVIHLLGISAAPPAGFSYWTLSDLYEENDTGTNTAFRGGNFGLLLKGDPAIGAASFDVAKPAFNAFRLLHLMGDVQIATSGGTTGNGVNAGATVAGAGDSSALQILVYNHTDGGMASSTASTLVNLTVNNLPFASGPVRVRQYVLDRTHANAYTTWVSQGSPARPTAAQWTALSAAAELCYYETTVTPTGASWSVMFPQNNYSVSLLVLSR